MKQELDGYIQQHSMGALWIEPYHIGEFLKPFNWEVKHALYIPNIKKKPVNFEKYIMKTNPSVYSNDIVCSRRLILDRITNHFQHTNIPIIIDDKIYSYCIASIDNKKGRLVIIDPHKRDKKRNHICEKTFDWFLNNHWMMLFPDTRVRM